MIKIIAALRTLNEKRKSLFTLVSAGVVTSSAMCGFCHSQQIPLDPVLEWNLQYQPTIIAGAYGAGIGIEAGALGNQSAKFAINEGSHSALRVAVKSIGGYWAGRLIGAIF